MRTVSTEQEDVLKSAKYDVYVRCEVENSTGGFVSLSDLNGDWFQSASWDWSLDQPVPQLTVGVRRDHGPSTGQSLAPLDENSTLNRDASTSYAPAIDAGREVKLFTATVSPGSAAPATSEMQWMFHGEIDDVNWQSSPLTFLARGKITGTLNDRWIESSGYVYPSSNGSNIETVLEDILADWTDLSTDVLWASSSVGFALNDWEQVKEPVLRAVTTVAQLVGFDLRERYSTGSTEWRLRFEQPNRTATSSETDWTFGPEQYFDVTNMNISRTDVRNVVSVIYGTSTNRTQVEVSDTGSIDKYGRRWMEIEEASNSAINSSGEADNLANFALSDLKDPAAIQEIETPYWWPGELQDYYQFDPNDIHYDTEQYLGVYGISHELTPDRHRTRVRVRGKPAGQYLAWHSYPGGGGQPEGLDVRVVSQGGYPVESTEANQQHSKYYIEMEPGPATKSMRVSYNWNQAGTSGYAISNPQNTSYDIDVTPGVSITHVLQEASSQEPNGDRTWVEYHTSSGDVFSDAFSGVDQFGSTDPTSGPLITLWCFADLGGANGTGLGATPVYRIHPASGQAVGVRVEAASSDANAINAYKLKAGSTNVLFEVSTDGIATITVI